MQLNMEVNQAQLIKNMEVNQARFTTDHAKEMCSLQSKLLAIEEKHVEEMKFMEVNYSNQIATMQNYLITMEANHEK